MADRFDKSLARRPAADPQPRRDEATLPDDDPLVELARIVSGNESFDQILGSRYRTPAEPPRPAAQPRAQQPRDFSFDLEAELLNDLHSSFDPSARQAEPPARPAAPVTPRAVEPPRAEGKRGQVAFDVDVVTVSLIVRVGTFASARDAGSRRIRTRQIAARANAWCAWLCLLLVTVRISAPSAKSGRTAGVNRLIPACLTVILHW